MVSSIDQTESSLPLPENVFRSTGSPEAVGPEGDDDLTSAPPPPPEISTPSQADDGWNISPLPNDNIGVQDQPTDYSISNDILDDVPYVLKLFLLGLGVTCITFWLYVYCQNRQYRKRIEETRQRMVSERRRNRTRRMMMGGSNNNHLDRERILFTLEDIFDYHEEEEEMVIDDLADVSEEAEEEAEHEYRQPDPASKSFTRSKEIAKRFHFHTVLSDSATSEGDVENPKCIEDASTCTLPTTAGETSSSQDTIDWFQSWRKNNGSPTLPTCCICLEDQVEGDTICVPITKRCNHVFHEECMVAWLQKHNDCPFCRTDYFLEDEADEETEEEEEDEA